MGGLLLVVCTVGVDLDVVPFAVDAWLAAGDPAAEIVLAMPTRDALPVTGGAGRLGETRRSASLSQYATIRRRRRRRRTVREG